MAKKSAPPVKPGEKRIIITMDAEHLGLIEAHRRSATGPVPNVSEAVRQMIRLAAEKSAKGRAQ